MYDRHMSIGERFDNLEVVSAPYLKLMEDHPDSISFLTWPAYQLDFESTANQ